jgi:hypothetical protein
MTISIKALSIISNCIVLSGIIGPSIMILIIVEIGIVALNTMILGIMCT